MIQFSTRTAAALLAALATIALCVTPQPASAAKKEAAAEEAPKPSFSKGFVKAAKSVQKDVDAKKWPKALAGIATLEALPDLNDNDWKVILNWKLLAQQGTGDTEGLMGTLETWLAKGYATPEQTVQFHQNLAAHYSKKNDEEKTLVHYRAFIDAHPDPEPDEIAVLGRIYMQRSDNEQAVAWLNKVMMVVGVLDDIRGLSSLVRLLAQAGACVLLIADGVHVLFLSEHDLPQADARARELLALVPMVAITRGWRGLTLVTRQGCHDVPTLPRPEVDPTGAGDVFAAAFLVRYQETGDPLEEAAFGACAASCAVEGIGASSLGDRSEVLRRMELRERMIETGEWED